MAILAAIEVWRARELCGVLISVAVRAVLELKLVDRVFAFRTMTLPTLQ